MQNTIPPAAVIFDLDGTLADTFALIVAAWNAATSPTLGVTFSAEEVIALFGVPEADMLRRAFADRPSADVDKAVDRFIAAYEEQHDIVHPFAGIPELLADLRKRGLPLGLVTGKGSETCRITLGKLGWTDMFGSVVTGDDVTHQKPNPEGVLRAARELGVDPSACVFIGDSPADVGAGRAAGMFTVAAVWHTEYLEELRNAGADAWVVLPVNIPDALGLETS